MLDTTTDLLAPVLSVAPIPLAAPYRGQDLHLRLSAPATGRHLPVILFSHGNGQSLHGYGPLANHWSARGFVVIQPTHLDSRALALPKDDPRRPQFWRLREQDLTHTLDHLGQILSAIPGLADRVDLDRIAVAGHSWGAQTASMLLGATHPDPADGTTVRLTDPRIKAGVLMTIPGTGGANLSPFAAANFPFMQPDFSAMTTPALIIAGDNDHGAMTTRGPDWWREAYDLSPSPKALLTLFGGEHSLGGIANYEARETTDENPARLAAVQALSTAWLQSALSPGHPAWTNAVAALTTAATPEGNVETK